MVVATRAPKQESTESTLSLLDECLTEIHTRVRASRRRPARPKTMASISNESEVDSRNEHNDQKDNTQQPPSRLNTEVDERACAVGAAFDHELRDWISKYSNTSQAARERFADHLTDRYLCAQLDPLPSTPTVTATRRRVVAAVEAFTSTKQSLPTKAKEAQTGRQSQVKEEPESTDETPWACALCGKKNLASTLACLVCSRQRGAAPSQHPERSTLHQQQMLIQRHKANKIVAENKTREIEAFSNDIRSVIASFQQQKQQANTKLLTPNVYSKKTLLPLNRVHGVIPAAPITQQERRKVSFSPAVYTSVNRNHTSSSLRT